MGHSFEGVNFKLEPVSCDLCQTQHPSLSHLMIDHLEYFQGQIFTLTIKGCYSERNYWFSTKIIAIEFVLDQKI